MKTLKVLNIEDIRSWNPCYDPVLDSKRAVLAEDWTDTILDLLKNNSIPALDRIWCACYSKQVSDKTLRLFAVWNARRELSACEKTYPEAIKCIDAAERYANGEGTLEELLTEQEENRAAYRAAYLAAYRAADRAADRAAYLAAYRAAYRAADRAADRAAYLAAYLAAQLTQLIAMVEQEYSVDVKAPAKRLYEARLNKTAKNAHTKRATYTISKKQQQVIDAAKAAGFTVEEKAHHVVISGAKSAQSLNKLLAGTGLDSSSWSPIPDMTISVSKPLAVAS